MKRLIAILMDIRTVSFGVLAIGTAALTVFDRWVEVGIFLFSWGLVQIVQLAIDEDTRVGEIFGTIGLLAICCGLYYFPMPASFAIVTVYCVWIWNDH